MSQENVATIQSVYGAFAMGDIPAVLGAMDPAILWNEAEGNPYSDGNPYAGPEAVLEGVFKRLGGDFENFSVVTEHLLDAGDCVVMLGRYRAQGRSTGAEFDAQCVHVWWLREGKIVQFQQYTDTAQWVAVLGATQTLPE